MVCPEQRLQVSHRGSMITERGCWILLEAKSFRMCYVRISHSESDMCEDFLYKSLIPRGTMGEGSAGKYGVFEA